METRPVPEHVTSLDFGDLTPGQAYTVTIQSKSGELINQNAATGRAGEALKLTWNICLISCQLQS